MTSLLLSLFPIAAWLLAGYILGYLLSPRIVSMLSRAITPFVWIMLFAIGYRFGQQLSAMHQVVLILQTALLYSVGITLLCSLVLLVLFRPNVRTQATQHDLGIMHVICECGIALAFLLAGLGLAMLTAHWDIAVPVPDSEFFLYILLFLIGTDLAHTPLQRNAIRPAMFTVPLVVAMVSLLAGALIAWATDTDIRHGLLLASGFGWFSLSGVLVTARLGEFYGATALLTDLFRELLSIIVLFFAGARYPLAGIGAAGATAMDTTLPIVRKTTGASFLVTALFSGMVLSLAAPFLLSYVLSLFD
ncbi:lysine exporter LysO family protein [Advenella mimigardefordensis]|uniref:Putative membrane protein n=1 Tax=Advenella mimigardefordensis (strain DSM 17166 / LMG 22922 / DPN7) TaxID=1247726 RepID=W0P6I9_ADVMD|nr:lysine exporter LysO family protein [Advenella mimigardefordensis]AHG62484.1 putative membrane protein [Advenella mimigardefordensis DPN7]